MSRAKNWCFTLNNYTSELDFATMPDLVYGIYGHEIAPTTGTPHLQGYLSFSKLKRLNQVTDIIPLAHFIVARGNPAQNTAYCSKGTDIRMFGIMPGGSGHRSDLDHVADAVKAGKTITQIAEEFPGTYIRYSKGIQSLKVATYKPTLRLNIRVYFLYGGSGKGKTRFAYDRFGVENVYKLDPNHNRSLWFDGYVAQPVLLLDDYDGWINFRTLLTILDVYPYTCQVKGGTVPAQWTTVVITSERHYSMWGNIGGDIAQLTRRITQAVSVDEENWINNISI